MIIINDVWRFTRHVVSSWGRICSIVEKSGFSDEKFSDIALFFFYFIFIASNTIKNCCEDLNVCKHDEKRMSNVVF